jgi:PIN like domain
MRIYFDENFSPHLVAGIRAIQKGRPSDGVMVASVEEEFGRGAPDDIWIPGVAIRYGIALTQDLNIHRVRANGNYAKPTKSEFSFSSLQKGQRHGVTGKSPSGDTALAGNQDTRCHSLTTLWFHRGA